MSTSDSDSSMLSFDSDEEYIATTSRRPRIFRRRIDYFNYFDDIDFKMRFRISKPTVSHLLESIGGQLAPATMRNHPVTPTQQLLLTLRFYALGSMLRAAGDFTGVSVSTACNVVWKVTRVIALLRGQYIKMSQDRKTVEDFYRIARFPKIIGAIDCTHVKIESPGGDEPERYRNRKGHFSINVQTICDANLFICNVVARWHGSAHDSAIFNNSNIKERFERGEFGDKALVGDSGYPRKTYLRKPLSNPVTDAERLYNESQIRTRNVIERCFGVWKRRFPVLYLPLRLHLIQVEGVIVATAVLHNIARRENEGDYPAEVVTEDEAYDPGESNDPEDFSVNDEFNHLINTYFQSLL